MKTARFLLIGCLVALETKVFAQEENPSLNGQIICGYQGWFAFPGDGAPINKWKHWFDNSPTVENLTVDMYPLMDEYDDEDLEESEIPLGNGFAKFYSTTKPNVVRKHFEWMKTYGITGVFHMRFMKDIDLSNNFNWKTGVLRNVRTAAEEYDRAFAVSYNMAGMDNSVIEMMKEDWKYLVDTEQITSSRQYIMQDGKPVLRIYGVGFDAVNVTDTDALADLIDWFQNSAEEKYRVFLVGGVPSQWRTLTGDARPETAWTNIYNSLDAIHPWHVGRWNSNSGFESYYTSRIAIDADYCRDEDILYMPTMFPGFSWHNLKDGTEPMNSIPRNGGEFMWAQAYRYVQDADINTIWMAQFDEVDEGTAIYKVAADASQAPDAGSWLTLDADGQTLPSDWYLRLCGTAQDMLEDSISLTSTIPISPTDPAIDSDGDGFTIENDCDDNNPDINPDAEDIPDNNIDENCDGEDATVLSTGHDRDDNLVIYPNPVSDQLRISVGEAELEIYDLSGNLIKSGSIKNGMVDVSQMSDGVYILKVHHNYSIISKHFIIAH